MSQSPCQKTHREKSCQTIFAAESAAIDFVRDAFSHLKAIAADKGGQVLLKIANVVQDVGIVDTCDKNAFMAAVKIRQWQRDKFVRTLS
jgi:catalase